MARHAALALLIPITGPRTYAPILQRWASNRSPFVMSGSKEVFERRTFHVEMDVWDADDKAAEILVKVLLASGRGEHVKVKVDKYSRGEFHLHADSPTTAPMTHTTKKMAALVQQIADRFVREERERIENMSTLDQQLHHAAEREKRQQALDENERIAQEAKSIQSDLPTDVVVPTDGTITITDAITKTSSFSPSPAATERTSSAKPSEATKLPDYAGQKVWERHNKDLASSPRAKAQAKLAALPPSNTIQIFPTSHYLASPATSDEETPLLSSEQVAELIRPNIHVRSTFHVSTTPLDRSPSTPYKESSTELPPMPRVKGQHVNPEKHIRDATREATIKSMPLPGQGAHYLVEFESVLEAQRVREMLDDQVLADGTSLDVWYHAAVSEADEEVGGSLHGHAWTEVRGAGSGEAWREVDLQEAADAHAKVMASREEAEKLDQERKSKIAARVKQLKEQEEAEERRVREEEDKAKAAASSTLETVAEEAEDAKDTVVEKAEEATDIVVDNVSAAKEAVQDKIENPPTTEEIKDSVVETAQETRDAVVEKATEAKEAVETKIADAPSAAEVASSAQETISSKAEDLKTAVKENAPDVPTTSEVASAVTEKAAEAKSAVEDKIEEVRPQAESLLESIQSKVADVQEVVGERVEEVKEKFVEAEEKVEKEVEQKKEELETKVDEAEKKVDEEVEEMNKVSRA